MEHSEYLEFEWQPHSSSPLQGNSFSCLREQGACTNYRKFILHLNYQIVPVLEKKLVLNFLIALMPVRVDKCTTLLIMKVQISKDSPTFLCRPRYTVGSFAIIKNFRMSQVLFTVSLEFFFKISATLTWPWFHSSLRNGWKAGFKVENEKYLQCMSQISKNIPKWLV